MQGGCTWQSPFGGRVFEGSRKAGGQRKSVIFVDLLLNPLLEVFKFVSSCCQCLYSFRRKLLSLPQIIFKVECDRFLVLLALRRPGSKLGSFFFFLESSHFSRRWSVIALTVITHLKSPVLYLFLLIVCFTTQRVLPRWPLESAPLRSPPQ